MKKFIKPLFLISMVLLLNVSMSAQINLCAYFDGFWSDWYDCGTNTKLYGSYAGFMIYNKEDGPWEPYFKFTIDNFYIPDSKTRKRHVKNDQWYEFTGTVEYYICDDLLSAYQIFKTNKAPKFVSQKLSDDRPTKKVTSQARIKIAPYKDHPKVYNIWYDNVGLGIDLNNRYFPQDDE